MPLPRPRDDLDVEREKLLAAGAVRLPLPPPLAGRVAAAPVGRAWLVTFADLVSLMLAFFVMLYAMRLVHPDPWREVVTALSAHLDPVSAKPARGGDADYTIATTFRRQAIDLDYLARILESAIGDDPHFTGATIRTRDNRLVLSLASDLLFAPDGAVMSERAREAVRNVGTVVRNISNQVGVMGHSDPMPSPPSSSSSPRKTFSSPWELSLVRAAAVANALHEAGYPDDIVVYGAGDTRFGDLQDLSGDQRNRLARRVDVLILPAATGR
ncbi:MAG: OmpA family protein [Alphaproteobacteria bacterium]